MAFGREGAIGCQIRQSGGSVRTASQQARVLPREDSPTRTTSWLWPPMALAPSDSGDGRVPGGVGGQGRKPVCPRATGDIGGWMHLEGEGIVVGQFGDQTAERSFIWKQADLLRPTGGSAAAVGVGFVPGDSPPLLPYLGRDHLREGLELSETPEPERPDKVLDLMAALNESVAQSKASRAEGSKPKPKPKPKKKAATKKATAKKLPAKKTAGRR